MKTEFIAAAAPEDDVAALIATLHETEQSLERLTGGEVDTVLDREGRPYLLRRAQEHLRHHEAEKQAAILNALPAHIALLDAQGVILSVNDTWRRFATANLLSGAEFGVGLNYLEVCDAAKGEDASGARQAAAGIREVLAGANSFALEYPCHAPTEHRWFLMTVSPLATGQRAGVVVMHMNITERKLTDLALRDSEERFAEAFEFSPIGVALVSPDGRWLRVNHALRALVGYTEAELLARTFQDITVPEDLAEDLTNVRQILAGEIRSYQMEKRYVHADGHFITVLLSVSLVRDREGRPDYFISQIQDITARKHAEADLQRIQKLLTVASTLSQLGAWAVQVPALTLTLSDEARRIHEMPPGFAPTLEEATGFYVPGDRAAIAQAFAECVQHGTSFDLELQLVTTTGRKVWVRSIGRAERNPAGVITSVQGAIQDISQHKLAEIALRTSEAEFRTLAESMPQIVWITRRDGWNTYFNQQWMDYTGLTLGESMGHGWTWPFHPEDQPLAWAAWQHAVATVGTYSISVRLRRADGVYRWWLTRGVPVRDAAGMVIKWFGTCTDIHELKTAELNISLANQALGAAEAKYRSIFENSSEGIFQSTADGRLISANPALARMLGFSSPEELIRERTDLKEHGYSDPAQRDKFKRRLQERGAINGYEYEIRRKDGSRIWVSENVRIVQATTGRAEYYEGSMQDITEHKQAVDALGESEKRFKALFEQAAVGVAQTDAVTGRYLQVNRRFCEIVGRGADEMAQVTFAAITHPQDVAHSLAMTRQLQAGILREFTQEKRYVHAGRADVWASVTVSAMWAEGEKPDFFIVVAQDITERKQLEEQFRQAQKMEAMGTLAGGIAHDFNNILAAINGYTELSRMALQGNPEVREYLGAVLQASSRAAGLVRQILTFSRQQPVERKPVQLRPIVEEAFNLLRATIPSTIEFDLALATDAPVVLADTTQIHQILMNLGTNAWHAMRDRPGRLTVRLERLVVDAELAAAKPRLRPGLYARLSVSDTGSGMDAATLARIFDPFFTTKTPGEGTGMGLAVVHGIMDSHDGVVTVTSQPGAGTVFRLYFPADAGKTATMAIQETAGPSGHGEWILFVDDEEMLVGLGKKSLVALGYRVEIATQPAAALALVRADPGRFALVLTDQTMPDLTGLELASQLRQIRPDLPVILLTGFSAALTPGRLAAAGVTQLLLKPTSIHSLGTAVHAALSGQPLTTHGSNPPY